MSAVIEVGEKRLRGWATLPITTTRMRNVRNDSLFNFVPFRHLRPVLAWGNDKLEAPEPVFREPKPPTNG
jgi:hypothetical protein